MDKGGITSSPLEGTLFRDPCGLQEVTGITQRNARDIETTCKVEVGFEPIIEAFQYLDYSLFRKSLMKHMKNINEYLYTVTSYLTVEVKRNFSSNNRGCYMNYWGL